MSDEHVSRFWTLRRSVDDESLMTCDLLNSSGGLEVRCHAGGVVLHSQRVASVADAMNYCEAWKDTYRAQGWIERLE